ncbi:MAG: TatD family hydrolase [bacterium]
MTSFVDVHTHLTHEDFASDLEAVVARAQVAGLSSVVVNGLEPKSNRMILAMSEKYPIIRAALGIYPLDAVCDQIPDDFPFEVPVFDVNEEIEFIRAKAGQGLLTAIGECGLDGYYLGETHLAGQESVFERLIAVAMDFNLPLIIHTRKCEKRAGEILAAHGVKKVNFHCFTGRAALAKEFAERHGWYFSIPANCNVNEGFQKMMKILPPELILTETDAPYLSPVKGQRNEPANVVGTVQLLGKLRDWTFEEARDQVFQNYLSLFGAQTK